LLGESQSITLASTRLDANFARAVEILAAHNGKIIVTGLGKSGHIAHHLAATLSSTGTRAVFLHASEAGHGDFGIYSPSDPTLMISKSGATPELLRLRSASRELGSPCIGILGNINSPLAAEMDIVLDGSVARESDDHNLVPTASSAVALALGHALAVALMSARDFSLEDYSRNHPSGMIGRNLLSRIDAVMHSSSEVAWVAPGDSLKHVVIEMTSRPLGAACVVDRSHQLLGLITDGDVRRALRAHDDIRSLTAADIMTANPITVSPVAGLAEALRIMEDRPSQISLLPVVNDAHVCVGLVRIHDIYQGIR
jgi:arabinose-5-phosphate isomerase